MDCLKSIPVFVAFALLALPCPAVHAAAKPCRLARVAEVAVSMDGLSPVLATRINGADARFRLDSGAFWSSITVAAAQQYGLKVDRDRLPGLRVRGAGGVAYPSVATVKEFTIFGIPVRNVDFLVFGSEVGGGAVGLIGQNILRWADIEYDLAHGAIRFFKSENCARSDLAYWVKPGGAYSAMSIEPASPQEPHTMGEAYLNGEKIRVMFDSGAATSLVDTHAASRAGITPQTQGATPAGVSWGIGRHAVPTWVAEFGNFKVGDEEIHHARLRFGRLGDDADMLLGADFLLSHRIYVSNSQHKLYFTYDGGPVFDLRPRPDAAQPGQDAAAQTAASVGEPADAAAFARRASIAAARMDLDHALADLTRACELAPAEPSYVFERGRVHFQRGEAGLALDDFNRTLQLQPGHLEALIWRAMLHVRARDLPAALTDLDTADRVAPKPADFRLRMADLYIDAGRPVAAIAQYDQWIDVHRDDAKLPWALNGRCWAQALTGEQLDRALKDCSAAIRLAPKAASIRDSRGLVYLRMGKLDKAIDDYDAALAQNPKIGWSLYGRGIARLRKGLKSAGEADLAAASAVEPGIADEARRYGIAP